MKNQIVYETEQALRVTLMITVDVEDEMGMAPEHVKIDGKRIGYNPTDARKVIKGEMTEETYLERYKIDELYQ